MKTNGFTITFSMGTPLPTSQHFTLMVLINKRAAFRPVPKILDLAVVLGVLEVFPLQHLHVLTMWARNAVVTLIAHREKVGNTGGALESR